METFKDHTAEASETTDEIAGCRGRVVAKVLNAAMKPAKDLVEKGGCVSMDFGHSPVPPTMRAAQIAEYERRNPPAASVGQSESLESD